MNYFDIGFLKPLRHDFLSSAGYRLCQVVDQVSFEPVLSGSLSRRANAVVVGKADTIDLGDASSPQLFGQMCLFAITTKGRVGLNCFDLPFQNFDVSVFLYEVGVVVCAVTALHTVCWPHDLVPTSFFNYDLTEQFLAGVIFAEGNVISLMPVSTAYDDIPAWLFA